MNFRSVSPPPRGFSTISRPLWALHIIVHSSTNTQEYDTGLFRLPLGYVVGKLWHTSIFCWKSSHRPLCRSELVTFLVMESLGVLFYIKFFASSMHKMKVSKRAGKTLVWKNIIFLLIEGAICAMIKEVLHRNEVWSRQWCCRKSAGLGQQACEESWHNLNSGVTFLSHACTSTDLHAHTFTAPRVFCFPVKRMLACSFMSNMVMSVSRKPVMKLLTVFITGLEAVHQWRLRAVADQEAKSCPLLSILLGFSGTRPDIVTAWLYQSEH